MIERNLTNRLQWALQNFRIVYLSGARQTGKTTLVRKIAQKLNLTYVNLDNSKDYQLANENPEMFLSLYQPPLAIDEVQKAPALIDHIKLLVDTRNKKGDFLLTGSINLLKMRKIYESLAGRIVFYSLFPFSTAELEHWQFNLVEALFQIDFYKYFQQLQTKDFHCIAKRLVTGYFPEIYSSYDTEVLNKWFSGYITTRIYKDLDLLTEKDLHKKQVIDKLLYLLAHQSSSLLNIQHLAQNLKIHHITAKSYIELLENLFVTYRLQPYYRNIAKQTIKTPKVYFVDTGLIAYLLNLSPQKLLSLPQHYFGQLLENFVFNELQKHISFASGRYEMFFYRDQRKREVDFVIENSEGNLIAVEVKTKSVITNSDLSGFRVLETQLGDRITAFYIFYGGSSISALRMNDRQIYLLPVGSLFWC